jgi:uncharacterized protein YecT (DUF1311 family)
MNRKGLILALAALVVVVLAAIGLSRSQIAEPLEKQRKDNQVASAETEEAPAAPAQTSQICGSNATYARLKEVAFEEAFRLRNDDPTDLDRLAASSVVRMENPVVRSSDEGLGTTVCAGRFVLEVPPGAERGLGGQRRLVADVEYAAQTAADGSGLVYQLNGADAIIQRLAAFSLGQPAQTFQPEQTEFAAADPADTVPPEVEPDPAPAPVARPEPRPAPRATPTPREAPKATARAEPRPTPRPTRTPRPTEVAKAERVEPIAPRRTSRPSFNCRYARTRGEIMVCESDRLAAKDRQMSSLFYSALADADPERRRQLRRTRDAWLRYRDRCRDEACVAQAYDGRSQEIRDIMEGIE